MKGKKEEPIMKDETYKNELSEKLLEKVSGGQNVMDDIYEAIAIVLKMLSENKLHKETAEEIIRRLENNESIDEFLN